MDRSKDNVLGERLRRARERAGLSLRQLGARADVDPGYLTRLESGLKANPSAEIVQRLADAMEADASELLMCIGVHPASTLPAPRMYFRRKLGVNAEEAEILAGLVEDFQNKKKGVRHEEDDEEGDGGTARRAA